MLNKNRFLMKIQAVKRQIIDNDFKMLIISYCYELKFFYFKFFKRSWLLKITELNLFLATFVELTILKCFLIQVSLKFQGVKNVV